MVICLIIVNSNLGATTMLSSCDRDSIAHET